MERTTMYRDEHLTIETFGETSGETSGGTGSGKSGPVELDCRRLTLTRKELELLTMLARNAGEIVPRDILLSTVWGYREGTRTRTLDVHIRRLRSKLGAFGDTYIQTVFGVGYRFERFRAARPLVMYALPAYGATA